MKVSIIITTYNSALFIRETLSSAINQSYKNLEIIIVDANSTDNTIEIIENFDDSRIRVIKLTNPSLAGATRNHGLKHATGDFINYLDGDDLMANNKIESQLSLLKNSRNAIATCKWNFYYQNGEIVYPKSSLFKNLNADEYISIGWGQGEMMPIMAYLIPKHIADKAGEWNNDLMMNEDAEYFLRLLLNTEEVIYADATEVSYRKHSSTSVSKPNADKVKHWIKAIEIIELNLVRSGKSDASEIIANLYQNFVYQVYPKYKEQIKLATLKINEYGGSTLKYERGGKFGLVSKVIGWKLGKQFEQLLKS